MKKVKDCKLTVLKGGSLCSWMAYQSWNVPTWSLGAWSSTYDAICG